MQVEEFPGVDTNVDLTQTVSYLNSFAQSCESRFMEFEYKIQKIEASLLILESQLSSISGLDNLEHKTTDNRTNDTPANDSKLDLPDIKTSDNSSSASEKPETVSNSEDVGVKACDDPRFKKFFKMLQFGVPEPAVKLKMQNDGVDPSILDKPNDIIPGSPQEISEHSVVEPNSTSNSE
ncbi:WASH complex subunit 3 isoform X2 [Anoplophora glabripennis]|uniref:WASH complex subunit 3 isoform X2 n=1 Tax=Anoplophora glabripennis TaxID=217634 RepID=UPI00087432D8|nr:WASH complex subunit 3 isoform X2 [Anoplophora glabripennis]